MGGGSGLPRRYGRRDVKLGKKKCFTAEVKCGILFMYLSITGRVVTVVRIDKK